MGCYAPSMVETRDVVPELLIAIRDEMKTTRIELSARIDATNERLDATRTELSGRIDRLEKRQTESEIRLSTAIAGLAGTLGEVRDLLKDRKEEQAAIRDHEKRIRALEKRRAS